MTFAENINRICKEKGTTLTVVVKEVKNSSSMTTAINKHKCIPKENDLIAFAKLLGCSVKDFFSDEVEPDEKRPKTETTAKEKLLLAAYRKVTERDEAIIWQILDEYLTSQERALLEQLKPGDDVPGVG